MTGVRFEDVSVSIEGRSILANVSFEIPAGERTALVGPNGGGKTTLVRILLGLLEPDSGRVVFVTDGKEVERPRVGYLPQRVFLAADAPVSGVDLVGLTISPRKGGREVEEKAAKALERAGLPVERARAPVGRLSGGQRQRVLLARAIAGSPDIVVLDEPDTALDAQGMMTLRRLVSEEIAAGKTVIYVTHDSDAMGGADAIFRIDGKAMACEMGG